LQALPSDDDLGGCDFSEGIGGVNSMSALGADAELWQEDFVAKQRKRTGPQENPTPDQQADTVYKIVDVVGVKTQSDAYNKRSSPEAGLATPAPGRIHSETVRGGRILNLQAHSANREA
jgi:hypothetical protein